MRPFWPFPGILAVSGLVSAEMAPAGAPVGRILLVVLREVPVILLAIGSVGAAFWHLVCRSRPSG